MYMLLPVLVCLLPAYSLKHLDLLIKLETTYLLANINIQLLPWKLYA